MKLWFLLPVGLIVFTLTVYFIRKKRVESEGDIEGIEVSLDEPTKPKKKKKKKDKGWD